MGDFMTLKEIDNYFNSFLQKENFEDDPSKNGIQIENSSPNEKQIKKVAFAVDACLETANKAKELGADLLFVHHGIFWGDCTPITGIHYKRIRSFIQNDIALYASHMPLDANKEVGNNYGLAKKLGFGNLTPFGVWHGMTFGVKCECVKEISAKELSEKLLSIGIKPKVQLFFGKEKIKTIAIMSGGTGEDHVQVAKAGIDSFIAGEVKHEDFHPIKEEGLNVIAGGHYDTETIGVKLVAEKLQREKGVETVFIDFPSGL